MTKHDKQAAGTCRNPHVELPLPTCPIGQPKPKFQLITKDVPFPRRCYRVQDLEP